MASKAPTSPIVTFLQRLRGNLRNHVPEDAFTAAVREARSHAGGTERARKQAEAKAAEQDKATSDELSKKDDDDTSTDDKAKASGDDKSKGGDAAPGSNVNITVKAASEVLFDDIDTFVAHDGPGECPDCGKVHAKSNDDDMKKRRRRAIVSNPSENQMFAEGCPCCGTSKANCTCGPDCPNCDCKKLATRRMNEDGPANFEPDLKLFFELQEFAEPPDWIPFLPTPGEYKHPKWGTVKMSRDRAQRMMKNFSDKVYQGHIPIDLEHSLKVSGAAGYVSDLRQNSDGSVDAKIDWTDLGRDAISKDRFRYFSPEWWDKWNHPTNGQQFTDVIVGGALTTRPFFKDSRFGGLRPLVASEDGVQLYDGEWSGVFSFSEERAMGMTPEETQRFNEMSTKFEELHTRYEASETQRTALEESLKTANEHIGQMQLEKDTARFTELSKNWAGARDKNVSTLLKMAETFGEDSDEFKTFVASMTAAAESTRKLFTDVGTGRPSTTKTFGGDILDEVNTLARAYMEAHPGVSSEVAQTMVFSERPDLYDQYESKRQTAVRDAKPV